MQPGADETQALQEALSRAVHDKVPLEIVGGGSKRFYGRRVHGEPFHVAGHRGVVDYEPTELVVTARAGTPLQELEALLAEGSLVMLTDQYAPVDQMLAPVVRGEEGQ